MISSTVTPNTFLTYGKPHKETLQHTISKWIKSQLKEVGTEIETFQGLSVRLA